MCLERRPLFPTPSAPSGGHRNPWRPPHDRVLDMTEACCDPGSATAPAGAAGGCHREH